MGCRGFWRNKLLSQFFFVSFIFTAIHGTPARARVLDQKPQIDIHIGRLSESDQKSLFESFLIPLATKVANLDSSKICNGARHFKLSVGQVDLRIFCRSHLVDIENSLQDPKTLGFVFAGNLETARGRLETSESEFLPFSMFSMANKNLKYLSVVDFGPSLGKKMTSENYASALDPQIGLQTFQVKDLSNFEMLLKTVLAQMSVLQKFEISPIPSREVSSFLFVKINFRNLSSRKYAYEVLIDNKLVALLKPTFDSEGHLKNQGSTEFKISFEAIKKQSVLTLRTDTSAADLDDLLVDQIFFQDVNFSLQIVGHDNQPIIHLGPPRLDRMDLKTAFPENQDDLSEGNSGKEIKISLEKVFGFFLQPQ